MSKERPQILCGSKQNKFVNDKDQIFAEHEQFKDIWTKIRTKWCAFFQVTVIGKKHESIFP